MYASTVKWYRQQSKDRDENNEEYIKICSLNQVSSSSFCLQIFQPCFLVWSDLHHSLQLALLFWVWLILQTLTILLVSFWPENCCVPSLSLSPPLAYGSLLWALSKNSPFSKSLPKRASAELYLSHLCWHP